MSELIDRQAAIDALMNSVTPYGFIDADGNIESGCKDKDVVEMLYNLPSAQPEPQWIPVSERLPSDGTWNIFTDGENISVERYKADAIDHFFPNGRWFQLEDVIAWMPLPEAYKSNK